MVTIGILYDHPRWEEKELMRVAESLGHKIVAINVDKLVFRLDKLEVEGEFMDADIYLQRAISFFKSYISAYFLESIGKHVVNSASTIWTCGNKFLTTIALALHGIPVPRTYLALTKEMGLSIADKLGYPIVVKPLIGSWGRLVSKADTRDSLESILEHRELLGGSLYNIHYIQEYVRKPGRDIRVFVIGDHVPIAIYRVNASNWRTNTALGAKVEPAPVTPELEELALKTAEAVGGGILGIDVFEDPERGLIVNEVNANTDFRNTVRVTKYNLARDIVEYLVSLIKR